ncbi:hypothetical protein Pmani_025897 [Petrolisthes manimaculis]|uniref:Uncharacterized protein n=1 Tax=Petrolisthes manimaculis TaxID=1843537 RepID=A0AAE1TXY6_9EUCA|nr:hypothetical protein Pmani_025897 [Petrolisthes manimaculis]
MTKRIGGHVWLWRLRLWCVAAVQEIVECWMRLWLVEMFRSPVMCRVSVKDDQWCMVPSLTQTMMSRVPAWKCVYDPWCGALIYYDTAPPIITRLTVLIVALVVSLMVVWSPRLLIYRPSSYFLQWLKRQTPRLVLLLVAGGSIVQLVLDHFFLPLVLPASLLLTNTLSIMTFSCSMLLMNVVLSVKVVQLKNQTHYTHQLTSQMNQQHR